MVHFGGTATGAVSCAKSLDSKAEMAIMGTLTLSGDTAVFETAVCTFSGKFGILGAPVNLGFIKTKTEYYGGEPETIVCPVENH